MTSSNRTVCCITSQPEFKYNRYVIVHVLVIAGVYEQQSRKGVPNLENTDF